MPAQHPAPQFIESEFGGEIVLPARRARGRAKRAFTAATSAQRCKRDIRLRDGSGAQCMRKATTGDLCTQHAKLFAKRALESVLQPLGKVRAS
jgi:hypothetical protein